MQKISQLFTNWIDLIHKIIPEHNPYFNLTSGISEMEIEAHKTLENGLEIPVELIHLYKMYNVKYHPVTAAFQFFINDFEYDLIPFENIKKEWEGIQDLYFEDALEEGNLENFDPKVKADDYANPRWIPFADGRNGDYLLFDTDPSELGTYGQIIELQNESWERNVVANSLEELFQNQIDFLQSGNPNLFDFILKNENKKNTHFTPASELKNLLKTVPFNEVKHLVPEDSWLYKECSKATENEMMVHFYEGDLEIDYIDLAQPFIEYERRNEDYETYLREQTGMFLLITGHLKANNLFSSNDDGAFGLVVLGDVEVQNMVIGGSEIHILQDLKVSDLLWGNYNHGSLYVACEIFARLILMTEEYGFDEEKNSYQSEYYFNEEGESYEEDIEQFLEYSDAMFSPEFLLNDTEAVLEDSYEDIYGWADIISRDSIIEALKENKTILLEKFNNEGIEKDPKTPFLKLKDAYKKIISHACPKLSSDKKSRFYKIIDEFEIEDEDNIDYTEIFEEIYDKTSGANIDFILYFDVKSEARDVLFNIKNALKNNFEIENPALPKEEDYAGKTYVLEDILLDIELALLKIDSTYQNGYKLTYLDIESDGYFVILHDNINKHDVKSLLNKIGFDSRINEKENLLENDHRAVPILFPNKNFTSKDAIKSQTENYHKVFEIYNQCEEYYDEAELDLSKIGVKIFVNKAHKRESDNKDIDPSIYFLMDNGAEIFVWMPRTNLISGLFKDKNNIEVLYKNVNNNIFQYRSIFDIPNAEQEIFSFNFAWQEFLTSIERSAYYYHLLFQTATHNRIKHIIQLPVVRSRYNDYEDSDKMPWLGDYNFAFDWTESNYVTFRMSEEIPSDEDFDCCRFYFDAFNDSQCRFRYNSSQLDLANDFYSDSSTAIKFLDYPLLKKAERIFPEGEKLILDDNKKYENQEKSALAQAEKEFKNLKKRIANYQVKKPFETIEIDGILFTLKDRKEAAELLKICTDFDGNEIYDTFDMTFVDYEEEDYKSFFLVAEQEVQAQKLNLDTYPPDNENCYILGYIFTQPLEIKGYIESYDLDFSPPIICLDNAKIHSLMLSGNTHYFHKNLNAINLHGEYNHGSLYIKGHLESYFIFADDFEMNLNTVEMVASYSSNDRDIKILHDLSHLQLTPAIQSRPLIGTHNLEKCLLDSLIYPSDRGNYRIKDNGYRSGQDHYQEGEKTFFQRMQESDDILDMNKIETLRQQFVAESFAATQTMFATHPSLKNLPLGELHYEYLYQDYTHLMYYFQETEDYYFIGYWNTWHHISVSLCFHKSDDKAQHLATVFYWDEKNEEVQFQYSNPIDEYNYYINIGQKIYFEAIEKMKQ